MAENSLRRLRRAAGFSSAKAFAEHVGIPAPTYAKYEQIDDGPDTSMPIKNAWTIADALGCSIDSLVGRGTDVPENSESGIFLRQFESLSEDGRRLVSEFMELAAKHEEEAKERRRIEIAAKYKPYLNEFLGQFIEKFDHGGGQDVVTLIGGESAFRALFKSFVESRAELVMQGEQDEKFEEAKEVYSNLGYAVHEEFEPVYSAKMIRQGEEGYEDALEEVLQGVKESFDRYAMFRAKEVVEGVMAAYDVEHPSRKGQGGNVEYAFIRLPE